MSILAADSEIKHLIENPGTSYWLRKALTSALDRDPVDAANDAGTLARMMEMRVDALLGMPPKSNSQPSQCHGENCEHRRVSVGA